MITSYAQNGEDVVLNRLFSQQPFGRYIDVGAADPILDSVTKIFYDRGWRGINIEPDLLTYERLVEERPRDVNLNIAVSDGYGRSTLYHGAEEKHGLATLDVSIAGTTFQGDQQEDEVTTSTLARICEKYVEGPIDFLKIDVEGWEWHVIAGTDWESFRPRVVIVEATLPNSIIPSHEAWEPTMLAVGYRCTLFDGLNRFYVDSNDLEGRALLSAPANPHDDYRRYDLELAEDRLLQVEEECRRLARYNSELEHRLRELTSPPGAEGQSL